LPAAALDGRNIPQQIRPMGIDKPIRRSSGQQAEIKNI
jgi:hypothetical protein